MAIKVLDLEGRRLYNSPSYRDILGDPEKLRGSLSFTEIHPDDRERTLQARKTVFIVDKNRNVVDRYRRLVHPSALLISDDFSTFDPTSI